MASTLPPTPSFNENVPVVTSAGGTAHAYKDPKSPESILRQTAELNAQAAVDSKFDVATSPYHDGFMDGSTGSIGSIWTIESMNPTSKRYAIQTILTIIILLFIFMVSMQKRMPVWLNMAILTVSVILMIIVIMLTVNRRSPRT
jgi:hypothetical protein